MIKRPTPADPNAYPRSCDFTVERVLCTRPIHVLRCGSGSKLQSCASCQRNEARPVIVLVRERTPDCESRDTSEWPNRARHAVHVSHPPEMHCVNLNVSFETMRDSELKHATPLTRRSVQHKLCSIPYRLLRRCGDVLAHHASTTFSLDGPMINVGEYRMLPILCRTRSLRLHIRVALAVVRPSCRSAHPPQRCRLQNDPS